MFLQKESIEWIALKACIITEQNNKCAMCKTILEDLEFTLHHIISRAKGGKSELDNLIGLCDKCHDIAELEGLNREEIINYYKKYSLNDYNEHLKPIKKGYFMPEIDNQIEYKYPKKIILQEKYTIPLKRTYFKYMLKYGKSLDEITKIFGVSKATIINWHKIEEKREWMEEILKVLKEDK